MMYSKIPQVRIALNWECRKTCAYCAFPQWKDSALRVIPPRGEAGIRSGGCEMSPAQVEAVARALVEFGRVTAVKLTGGDPVWRRGLVEIVRRLKTIPALKDIELVTKAPIRHLVRNLRDAGLTAVTISLDSLQREKVKQITRVDCLRGCLDGIVAAREAGLPVTVNTVVMRDINDDEVEAMIEFTAKVGATLKLLDVIRLIDNEEFWQRHFLPLSTVCKKLESVAIHVEVETHPGGIGHPMRLYHLANGARVLVKDATAGAWYGDICWNCPLFPCHDAITALWVTPDGKLKQCLTRDDHYVDLLRLLEEKAPSDEVNMLIQRVLRTYTEARFLPCPWASLIPTSSGDGSKSLWREFANMRRVSSRVS